MKRDKILPTAALWALFLALALAVSAPMLRDLAAWGAHDWPQFYTYYGVPRRAVVEYGELPGWNPYYYGGTVQWGHPDDPSLSVVFLPVVLFGEVAGSKIAVVLSLAGGMYSMWLLARRLWLSRGAALFAAAVWGLNGWHAYHLAVGHCDHLTFLFLPLAVFFFLKAIERTRWAAAAGAVIAMMYLSGGPYPLVFTSILLVVLSLPLCGVLNSARPLKAAAASVVFAAGLAAVKLLSTLEFMRIARASPPDASGTPLGVLWHGLFDPLLPMVENYQGLEWGGWEYAAFIGYVPAAVFLLGAAAAWRRAWPWAAVGVVFLVASLGSASPVDFFALFAAAPGLSGMHVPFRFIVNFILVVAIVGGMGLDCIRAWLWRSRFLSRAVPLAVLAVAAGSLIRMHYNRPVPLYGLASYRGAPAPGEPAVPDRSPAAGEEADTTEDRRYVPVTYPQTIEVYNTFLEAGRLPWGYDAIHLVKAASFPEDEEYRGQAYFAGAAPGEGLEVESTLSTYRVAYTADTEATIVLNQNYHPGWKVRGGAGGVFDLAGLAAAKVSPGAGEVVFEFRPLSRLVGAAITLASVLAAVAVFVAGRRLDEEGRLQSLTLL